MLRRGGTDMHKTVGAWRGNRRARSSYQCCRPLNLCPLRMKWINFYNFRMDMLHTSYYFQHEKMGPRVRYRYRLHEYSTPGKIRIAAGYLQRPKAQPFNLRYIASRAILGIVRKRQVQQQKSRIDATT